MTEQDIKDFSRFLKDNVAYSAFVRNYNSSFNRIGPPDNSKLLTLREYLENIFYGLVLTSAFGWACTNEGYIYWAYLNQKWHVHIWDRI